MDVNFRFVAIGFGEDGNGVVEVYNQTNLGFMFSQNGNSDRKIGYNVQVVNSTM